MFFVHPQIKLSRLQGADLFQKLAFHFPDKQFVFTDMGRSAFKIIVEKLNLQNSEILFPAYICDIFRSVFKKYNIKPIFLDIDLKTFHLKVEEVEKKITPGSRAILVCHTYGLPFDVQRLKKRGLLIIEDCAHSFGARTGNGGQAAFFSLYKQFPALRGGMLVCPKDWEIQLPRTSFGLRDFISFLNCFSSFAFLFKKFGSRVAPRMLRHEKLSRPAGINRISLKLFANSLNDFEQSLEKRKKLALFFQEELKKLGFEVQESENNVFCYLSALVPKRLEEKRDKIVQKLRKYRVFCTRIWHTPIILIPEVQAECNLNLNDYPNTVEVAKRIINFPLQNYYTEKDIKKIIRAIKKILEII